MDQSTAEIVLYSIAGSSFVVWLAGCWFVRSSWRPRTDHAVMPSRQRAAEGDVSGEIEIDGDPDDLQARAAAQLVRGIQGMTAKILDRTRDSLTFEVCDSRSRYRVAPRAELRFARRGSRTAVSYWVEAFDRSWLRTAAWIFLALGLVLLIGGVVSLQAFVIHSENPAVRGMVLQMLQIVHFLWPPFVLAGTARMQRRAVQRGIDAFVHNLPYAQA